MFVKTSCSFYEKNIHVYIFPLILIWLPSVFRIRDSVIFWREPWIRDGENRIRDKRIRNTELLFNKLSEKNSDSQSIAGIQLIRAVASFWCRSTFILPKSYTFWKIGKKITSIHISASFPFPSVDSIKIFPVKVKKYMFLELISIRILENDAEIWSGSTTHQLI